MVEFAIGAISLSFSPAERIVEKILLVEGLRVTWWFKLFM
jgi:hypothetical protein